MKRILCYGDSNTWGSAAFGERIDDDQQWPNILQRLFGSGYRVIQEGLNARVAGGFEVDRPYLNGRAHYESIVRNVRPVDVVIIALGTNDIKVKYGRSARQIVDDLLWYETTTLRIAERFGEPMPRVVYLLPANFIPGERYFEANESVRQDLITLLKTSGQEYIELDEPVKLTEDGVHYALDTHKIIAHKIYEKLQDQEETK